MTLALLPLLPNCHLQGVHWVVQHLMGNVAEAAAVAAVMSMVTKGIGPGEGSKQDQASHPACSQWVVMCMLTSATCIISATSSTQQHSCEWAQHMCIAPLPAHIHASHLCTSRCMRLFSFRPQQPNQAERCNMKSQISNICQQKPQCPIVGTFGLHMLGPLQHCCALLPAHSLTCCLTEAMA
jgi:hypothetical protein